MRWRLTDKASCQARQGPKLGLKGHMMNKHAKPRVAGRIASPVGLFILVFLLFAASQRAQAMELSLHTVISRLLNPNSCDDQKFDICYDACTKLHMRNSQANLPLCQQRCRAKTGCAK